MKYVRDLKVIFFGCRNQLQSIIAFGSFFSPADVKKSIPSLCEKHWKVQKSEMRKRNWEINWNSIKTFATETWIAEDKMNFGEFPNILSQRTVQFSKQWIHHNQLKSYPKLTWKNKSLRSRRWVLLSEKSGEKKTERQREELLIWGIQNSPSYKSIY